MKKVVRKYINFVCGHGWKDYDVYYSEDVYFAFVMLFLFPIWLPIYLIANTVVGTQRRLKNWLNN